MSSGAQPLAASGLAWLVGAVVEVLARSGDLPPTDDRAIIRDNRVLGYPTLSTFICIASLSATRLDVHYGEFAHPGEWASLALGLDRPAG